MSDLVEFLLACYAEDEATAKAASGGLDYNWGDYGINPELLVDARFFERFASPARVLAKCAADRAIVEEHGDANVEWDHNGEFAVPAICRVCHDRAAHDAAGWPCRTLRLLALPYAGHPDFREEWRA